MRPYWIFVLSLLLTCILASCAKTSVFHAKDVEDYSMRLAEVVYIGTRSEYENNDEMMKYLTDFGINKSDISDGSVVVGRTYCCGGPNEKTSAIWFYVPKPLSLELGDIVEVWSGESVTMGSKPMTMPNTAIRVRQKGNDTSKECKWIPENPNLWMRYLYCDWMEEEGWVQQDSKLYPCWIKRTAFKSPPEPVY